MGLATKPLELTQGLIPTASQWNSLFDTLYTTVNGNIDEANVDTTKVAVLATAQTFTGIKTFTGGIVLNDDIKHVFGTGSDYWFQYDGSNTQFEFMGTNVDGVGADGIIFKIDDGTDDVDFTGGMTVGSTVLVVDQANARVGIGGTPHASGPGLQVLSTLPRWGLTETDASANNQNWQWVANGGELFLQSLEDDWGSSGTFLGFTRSGASIGEIQFRNGTSVWDATGLGIGTTSPSALLDISNGSEGLGMQITAETSTHGQWIATYQTTTPRAYFGHQNNSGGGVVTGGTANAGVVRSDAGLHLTAGSIATQGITIQSGGGSVGIGTTTPGNVVDIITGATTNSTFHLGEVVNEGIYMSALSDTNGQWTIGAELDTNTWYARATSAMILEGNAGAFQVYADDSLTDGNSYTPTQRFAVKPDGDVEVGTAALNTTAVAGFLNIPSCNGTPTGVPTPTSGLAPVVFDYANRKLYVYDTNGTPAWVAIN